MKFLNHSHYMSTTASSIPNVWCSADHQSITWCNQLMRATASLLMSIIGKSKTYLPLEDRADITRRIFLSNIKSLFQASNQTFQFGLNPKCQGASEWVTIPENRDLVILLNQVPDKVDEISAFLKNVQPKIYAFNDSNLSVDLIKSAHVLPNQLFTSFQPFIHLNEKNLQGISLYKE